MTGKVKRERITRTYRVDPHTSATALAYLAPGGYVFESMNRRGDRVTVTYRVVALVPEREQAQERRKVR